MKAKAIFTSRCCNSFRRAEHKQEKLHGLAQMQRGRLEPIWPSKLSRHVVMNTSTPNYKMKTVASRVSTLSHDKDNINYGHYFCNSFFFFFFSNVFLPVSNSTPNSTPSSDITTKLSLTAINTTSQLPLKLTGTNYPSWRAQFTSLLIGYELLGYVDGYWLLNLSASNHFQLYYCSSLHFTCIPALVLSGQLLNAIFSSVSENVMPLVATADTSREAWSTLARLFANRSRTRVMQLKETLTSSQRGTRSFSEFLQSVKSIADELALVDTPLTNDDLTLHILNGLGDEFHDIVGPIRARESSLSFEELHDLLIGYEADLK